MKKKIKLTRIHCAGCAVNLEDKIKEIDGVDNVSIDFLSKTVNLEVSSKADKDILEEVKNCITKFDSSIKIVDTAEEEKLEKKEKCKKIFDIVRVVLAICLSVVGFFIPNIQWLKISLFLTAYLFVGYEVIYFAIRNIIKGKLFDENFLMTIATIGALVLQDYIEAIAVMLLYTVGEFLEKLAVEKSRRRVKNLLSIKAESANLLVGSDELVVTLDKIKVNDIIRIKPGEKVPLDCVVTEGNSYLNTSAITGESKDIFVKEGNEILSGSINGEGLLLCKVLKTEKESTVSKIINLVENATKTKAKTEKFITKFAKCYTPIVVVVALLLAFIPLAFGADLAVWGYKALVFLVVSCPCALVISIPLGYFAGIGTAARRGVLIKGATYIDLLADINTVIFDKTGTLTYGDFEVSKIYATKISSQEEVLELIAYAESFSNHRIAKSIVDKYAKQINTAWVEDYKEIAGKGIEAKLFYEECLVGNAEFLKEKGVKVIEPKEAGTKVYLAKSGEYLGCIVVKDKIKEDSFGVAEALRSVGVKNISMFTGDNESVAGEVADKLKLSSYYANLLPLDKVETLRRVVNEGNKIAFVGDGINDAPVLASVDVGVSMGGMGSDAAIESADVILMTDEPTKLVEAVKISKKTKNIIMQNIVFIMLTKLAVMGLSIFGITGMWLAIFADVGVCLLAVLNDLRIMFLNRKDKRRKKEV